MTDLKELPDEILINILYYSGIDGTNNYIAATNDSVAKDNLLWYEFSKLYYDYPYDPNLSYYHDVNYLLNFLAEHDDNDIIKFLVLNRGEDVIYKYLAAKYGVNHKFKFYTKDIPLICFVWKPKLADWMLTIGCDIHVRFGKNETVLFWCKNGNMAQWFIDHGIDVNATNQYNSNPLFLKISLSTIKVLVKNGININQRDRYGRICLTYMLPLSGAKYLYKHGVNINNIDNSGGNLLHTVNSPKIAKWLIDLGMNVNQINNHQNTPIFSNRVLNVIKVLINEGAQLDYKDRAGRSILYPHLNHPDILDYLFTNKYVDMNDELIKTNNYAFFISRKESLRILINNGLNINHQRLDGNTALHLLNSRHREDLIIILINNGADVNIQNDDGKTPIFYAVDIEIAKLLIKSGANLDIKDNDGKTAPEVNRRVYDAMISLR